MSETWSLGLSLQSYDSRMKMALVCESIMVANAHLKPWPSSFKAVTGCSFAVASVEVVLRDVSSMGFT